MDAFVTSVVVEDDDAPAPPKESLGRLAKGERPRDIPRTAGELMKHVVSYPGLNEGQKKKGSTQFRYLVRNMHGFQQLLKNAEKTLKLFVAEVCNWQKSVRKSRAAQVYSCMRRTGSRCP